MSEKRTNQYVVSYMGIDLYHITDHCNKCLWTTEFRVTRREDRTWYCSGVKRNCGTIENVTYRRCSGCMHPRQAILTVIHRRNKQNLN